jgi:hypothetical protein
MNKLLLAIRPLPNAVKFVWRKPILALLLFILISMLVIPLAVGFEEIVDRSADAINSNFVSPGDF